MRSLHRRLQAVLADYDCQFVGTLREAKDALMAAPFNLVVVCVLFSESRMFDLLSHILNDPRMADTPIVCLRGEEGSADEQWKGIDLSVKTIGARFFLDLRKIPDADAGNHHLAQLFRHFLLLEADMRAYRGDQMGQVE